MNYNDFIEYISKLDINASLGLHGITGEGDYLETAKSILRDGLQTKSWGGILSNVQMIGQIKNLKENDYLRIRDYIYSIDQDGMIVNVVFAFPETFTSLDGKEYFLGHFNPVQGFAKGEENGGESLPFNQIVTVTKKIPKEFILGFYVGKVETDNFTFYQNPTFYMNNKEEFKSNFEKLLIENGIFDIEKIYSNIDLYKQFGLYNEYHRQLEEYMEKKLIKNDSI